jgi:hypothetical protein
MDIFTVSLFGHREISNLRRLEELLYPIIKDLIKSKSYVSFLVGRNGEFDVFSASVVKRVIKAYGNGNIGMTLVLPYPDKDIEYYYDYYDSVMIPECIGKTHPKGAITKRNKWMVEHADLLIAYVEPDRKGGALTTLKYAQKQGMEIINLAEVEEC